MERHSSSAFMHMQMSQRRQATSLMHVRYRSAAPEWNITLQNFLPCSLVFKMRWMGRDMVTKSRCVWLKDGEFRLGDWARGGGANVATFCAERSIVQCAKPNFSPGFGFATVLETSQGKITGIVTL